MNTTESQSNFEDLENMSVLQLLKGINNEDKTVPLAVEKVIPSIEKLVLQIVDQLQRGGRLFYIGAGTSGRMGVVDASECPPTFGVSENTIIGIIAGGEAALRKAVEHAEDDREQAWEELCNYSISDKDIVIGITASGHTPFVVGGLEKCKQAGVFTAGITCNTDTPLAKVADIIIEAIVGPEFVTGSTRMKAGTAQKLILNMISTALMIRLGKVKGNKMVDMQLSNNKLIARGIKILKDELEVDDEKAAKLLEKHKSVRKAIEAYRKDA